MNSKRTASRDWTLVVARVRGKHKMTTRQIASRLGVSLTGLSNLSSGRTKEPLYGVGIKLLELLEKGA